MKFPDIKISGLMWPTFKESIQGMLVLASIWFCNKIIDQIGTNPALLANASYMQFVGTLVSGTLLLAAANFWHQQTSKKEEETNRILAEKLPPVTGEAKVEQEKSDAQG